MSLSPMRSDVKERHERYAASGRQSKMFDERFRGEFCATERIRTLPQGSNPAGVSWLAE